MAADTNIDTPILSRFKKSIMRRPGVFTRLRNTVGSFFTIGSHPYTRRNSESHSEEAPSALSGPFFEKGALSEACLASYQILQDTSTVLA